MAVIKPVMGCRLDEYQNPRAEVDQRAEFEVVESRARTWPWTGRVGVE